MVRPLRVEYAGAFYPVTARGNECKKIYAAVICFRDGYKSVVVDKDSYLLKRHTAASNRDIGQFFGGLSYSAVAKTCQRLDKQLEADRSSSEFVMSLSMKLSCVKG